MLNPRKEMVRRLAILGLFLFPLSSNADWLERPNASSPPVNQLRTHGNACGPACLLDAFRSGNSKWQKSIAKIKGKSDPEKIKTIIATHGVRGSRLDPKKRRWNTRYGVSGNDLADMANELKSERWMGTVRAKILFRKERQKETDLLRQTHKQLVSSMKRGLPPILRIRRVAWRSPQGTKVKAWLTVKRHFLVLTGLPEKIPRGATSFAVTYHDPWGGKKLRGTIRINDEKTAGLPTLVADFPQSIIGKDLIQRSEPTSLSISSAIGLF